MSKLGDLNPRIGDWNWPSSLQTMEEPFFHGVVIQGSIYVDWPYGSPVYTPGIQQTLCFKLPFVPALWVNCISLLIAFMRN